MSVHHIVVAHNVVDRSRSHFGGGSGTLAFMSELNGKDHYGDPKKCLPFNVGWLDRKRKFVHVLDDAALQILLNELDTITDFVGYLREKETLLSGYRERRVAFVHAGEEDLLANYLQTMKGNRHGFSFPEGDDTVVLEKGDWVDFQKSSHRSARVEADKVSYLWDEVIEKFNKNILEGTSAHGSTPLIRERERIMRFFAGEPRLRRRVLAEALLGLVEKAKPKERTVRVVPAVLPGEPHYCFLALANVFSRPEDEYRSVRAHLLEALCLVTRLVYPKALDVIGFATEPGVDTIWRSEDALYFDARNWTEELETQARKLQSDLGLLTNLTMSGVHIREYPLPGRAGPVNPGPNPRNKLCPCGSGKKYKKCHGR
jgi:hypothetical protein